MIEFKLEIQDVHAERNDYNGSWTAQGLLDIDIADDIDDHFDNSFPNVFTNPYDPEDINIEVTFTHTSTGQKFTSWAFYYRDFQYPVGTFDVENLPEQWESTGSNNENDGWRVRFSPPVTGDFTSTVKITCYQDTPHKRVHVFSDINSFTVGTSSNNGYLQFNDNSKYMSFSGATSTTFIPVGYGLIQNIDGNKYSEYPGEFYLKRKLLENLEGRGNYTRTNVSSLDYPVESENPGSYDYEQAYMWELDQLLQSAEQKGIYILFTLNSWETFLHSPNADLDDDHETDNDNFTKAYFKEHPYRKDYQLGDNFKLSGIIDTDIDFDNTPLTDFFYEEDAKTLFKNRLRYIIARWGYSTNISAYDLFGEIDNTVVEWNDGGGRNLGFPAESDLQENVFNWGVEMGEFIKNNDPNHLLTICKANYQYGFGNNDDGYADTPEEKKLGCF